MRVPISLKKLFVLVTLWSFVILFSDVDRFFSGEVTVSDKGTGLRHLLNFENLKRLIGDSTSSGVLEEDMKSYTPVRIS